MLFRQEKPIVVKRYDNEKEFQRDASKMQKRGYKIIDVKQEEQGYGCAAIFTLGLIALLTKRPVEYMVTYQRIEN